VLQALRLGHPLIKGSAGVLVEADLFLAIVVLLGQHAVGANVGKPRGFYRMRHDEAFAQSSALGEDKERGRWVQA
jgi:hypothetical protein